MGESFFVTAIVVSHDGATWLPDVIASLLNQTRPVDRIIAVDTGSEDASPRLLANAGIQVLDTGRDVGFGSAIDQALEHLPSVDRAEHSEGALDSQVEWLWLIHDDCAPSSDALALLLENLHDRPNVAIAGPKLRGWYDHSHLLEVGISIASNGVRWTGLEERETDQGQHDEVQEVLSVSTAAMLVRRSVFEDIGGFDPNLELFRDDVDLGWRAHAAGYSAIAVGSALAFHAEAAASERRSVDVSEAFLHRPLLLDRRNAAYVLLANSSWWLLPWVSIQLLFSSLIRASVNLLAKLPGYAIDELGAIILLLIKPADLIQGRNERRHRRLMPAGVVRRFIPSRILQFRHTRERLVSTILVGRLSDSSEDEFPQISGYSNIGELDENFDQIDLSLSPSNSSATLFSRLRSHPVFIALAFFTILTSIASHHRIGVLSGGALPVSPSGAMDALKSYASPWHLVGLGSSVPSPSWLAYLGIASIITWANLSFFIGLLFWIAPPLAFFTCYRAIKRFGVSRPLAIAAGTIYALSPTLWASINQGRLGTIILAILAPTFLSLLPPAKSLGSVSWRRIYPLALLACAISAFTPLFLLGWSGFALVHIGRLVWESRSGAESASKFSALVGENGASIKRWIALLTIPWLCNVPWSINLLFHPSQLFLEPGLLVDSGTRWSVLLLNPGGLTAMPMWLVMPGIFLLFLTLLKRENRNWGMTGAFFLSCAIVLASIHLSGHSGTSNIWTGSILIFVQLCGLIPIARSAHELLPNLRSSKFGLGHAATIFVATISLVSVVGASAWVINEGAASLVKSDQPQVIPAFVTSLADTVAKPKSLIFRRVNGQLSYFVSRGFDLGLGDPDVSIAPTMEIQNAVNDLVSGTGVTSSKTFGEYGIHYLYLENPIDQNFARTVDGIGGFTRSSSTAGGIVWHVVGAAPRVIFTSAKGTSTGLSSNDISANDVVKGPGTITVAENYDQRWRLISAGLPIPLRHSLSGLPTFTVVSAGSISLSFDGTAHRAWLSLQLLSLLIVIVLALPAGRRRREVPNEELT